VHGVGLAGVAEHGVDVLAAEQVAVSAVPPVLLGLVGHLHALVSDDDWPAIATAPDAEPVPSAPVASPARTASTGATCTGTRRATRTGSGAGTRTGGRAPARTDAELTAALAELPCEPDGTVPIRRATAALACGPDRARRLLAAAGLLRLPAVPIPTSTDDPARGAAPIAA